MADYVHEDVPIHVRKSADGQMYEVGIEVNGAFHRFAQFKAGGFDHRQKKAQQAQDASASQSSE